MKICKMDKFIIAIVFACVAFVFSSCKEETSRQMESSSSSVTKESVKFRRINAKIDSNSNWYRRGKPIPDFNEERETTFFYSIPPGMDWLPDNRPKNIKFKYRGNVERPSLSDFKVKNKKGSNRTASDIMKIVRRRAPGLRHVYNNYLKKNPGFQGKITLEFTIAPKGEITDISIVSSTMQNRKFDAEIQQSMNRWVFHRIESGETTVTIPFTFTE